MEPEVLASCPPAIQEAPAPDAPVAEALPAPIRWTALLNYAGLVFFSSFLALFMAEATDPVRGFLPVVLDPPPAHSAPRGFEASFGVSRLYARSTVQAPRPLVANGGDFYRYPPQDGLASWYGYDHIGRRTADGGWFDPEAMTAAHRSLPFGSVVRVTRLSTGRSVEVTINDRGPYIEGRVIDLSRRAATELGIRDNGIARCRVEVLRYPYDGPISTATPVESAAAAFPDLPGEQPSADAELVMTLESPPPPLPISDPVTVATSVSGRPAPRSSAPSAASRPPVAPEPASPSAPVPAKKADPALKSHLSDVPVQAADGFELTLPPLSPLP